MDTLLSLRVFAAVADLKSFTQVANRFNLSPAMTSKHVQHVEARVGARLLNRNSRNVSLTEAGERYLLTVRPLLEGLDVADAQLSEETLAPTGTLKISVPIWLATPRFARIITDYQLECPDVMLDLDLSGRMVNLVEERVDLALRVTRTIADGLIARKLMQMNFPIVASRSFLDKHGRPESTDDLQQTPFLSYGPVSAGGRVKFGSGEDALDLRFKSVMQTSNETLILMATREGMGFSILPEWLCRDDIEKGLLEPILTDLKWPSLPLVAIYPDRSYLPAKVRSFLDFLAGPKGLQASLTQK